MLLVTNIDFGNLLRESRFDKTSFELSVEYSNNIYELIDNKCNKAKSAEIYWNGSCDCICSILREKGIEPVNSVNKIQESMKIIYVISENSYAFINIKKMKEK